MKTRLAPINQKKNLTKALKPYRQWHDWVRSPACFLRPQDIDLIRIYKQTGSYAACRQQLRIGLIEAANRLIYLTLRLKAFLPLYQEWEQGQKSLYDLVSFAEIKTVEDLKAITFNDLNDHCHTGNTPGISLTNTRKPP